MSGKGKPKPPPRRREVFGSKLPPTPASPLEPVVFPVVLTAVEQPAKAVVASTVVPVPVTPTEHHERTKEAPKALEALPTLPVTRRGAGGGLSMTSPFTEAATLVDPSLQPEPPKPCRRGHVRAKVMVDGSLSATGYTLDGEYRTRWSKGDEGEFPRMSVDGIYLEAL